MKFNHFILLIVLSFMSLATRGNSSFAQGSGTHGGDPNELAEFSGKDGQHLDSWSAVREDFISWLESNAYQRMELPIKDISKEEFKLRMLDAFRTTKLHWDDAVITVDDSGRPCENYRDSFGVRNIHCNHQAYQRAMSGYDPETQYKMIGHEYLSVEGFEPNLYGVSSYAISGLISNELRGVWVKRLYLGNDTVTLDPNKTLFTNINELFDSANPVDATKLTNSAQIGRCFLAKEPNNPLAAVYLFGNALPLDAGPLSDPREQLFDVFPEMRYESESDPGVFDKMTIGEIKENILDHYRKILHNYYEIRYGTGSLNLSSNAFEASTHFRKFELKVAGNYLVQRSYPLDDQGNVITKLPSCVCYYYMTAKKN